MRRLADYEPILANLLRSMAKDIGFYSNPSLTDVFSEHSRLIVAINHATPLSWLPSVACLAVHACARGGENRRPMGVIDHFFFQVPFLKQAAQFLTQTDGPLSYRDLAKRFAETGDIDLVVFPEGSNCFFGDPSEVQEFRSPKFIELSIETGAPILVAAHTGSEHWALSLPVSDDIARYLNLLPRFAYDFLESRVKKTGRLVLPMMPLPMDRFDMACEVYRPKLQPGDLEGDRDRRRAQLFEEAENIRQIMQRLIEDLRSGKKPQSQAEVGNSASIWGAGSGVGGKSSKNSEGSIPSES